MLQGMKGSVQSPDTCFLDIENFDRGTTTGKKFHNSSDWRMCQMIFLSRIEAVKKPKRDHQWCSRPPSLLRERVLHIPCSFRFRDLLVNPVLDKEFHLLVSHPMIVSEPDLNFK